MRNVLVIEDDLGAREVLGLRLGALNCRPIFATTADEAERVAAQEDTLSLIICDLKIDGDPYLGTKLVERLKNNPGTASVPIVVHSIFVSHPTDMQGEMPYVEGYLPKPFSFLDLKALIEALPASS